MKKNSNTIGENRKNKSSIDYMKARISNLKRAHTNKQKSAINCLSIEICMFSLIFFRFGIWYNRQFVLGNIKRNHRIDQRRKSFTCNLRCSSFNWSKSLTDLSYCSRSTSISSRALSASAKKRSAVKFDFIRVGKPRFSCSTSASCCLGSM